jgi:hypothetical protein
VICFPSAGMTWTVVLLHRWMQILLLMFKITIPADSTNIGTSHKSSFESE